MRNYGNHIDTLENLFCNLPDSLPLNPIFSSLNFELDLEQVQDEGWGVEFNHHMEVAWQSWHGLIQIAE